MGAAQSAKTGDVTLNMPAESTPLSPDAQQTPRSPMHAMQAGEIVSSSVRAASRRVRSAQAVITGQSAAERSKVPNQFGVYEAALDIEEESQMAYPPDGTFSYLDGVAREGGRYVRTLPETIYAALILGHLVLDGYEAPRHRALPKAETCCDAMRNCCTSLGRHFRYFLSIIATFVVTDLPLILTWGIAVAVQFTLSYYLHDAVVRSDGDLGIDCSNTSFTLRIFSLSAFVGLSMNDMFETYAHRPAPLT